MKEGIEAITNFLKNDKDKGYKQIVDEKKSYKNAIND
jgi:hypothetical protein